MKKFALAFCAVLSLSVLGLTGCGGGGGENTVVDSTDTVSEMAPEEQASYEEYMKNQQQRPGN